MHALCFLASILSRSCRIWLSSVLVLLLICFCLLFGLSSAQSATKHGCAPDTPPPVPGTPVPAPSIPDSVTINEVLSQPASTWNCSEPQGTHSPGEDSWIELYNTQDQPLDLYSVQAEISLDGGTTWYYLPSGSAIAPHSFLVIFPLENSMIASPPVWNVTLAIGGVTIDQASIPALQTDQSYARMPDGSSNWQYVGQPTIDASNDRSDQPVTPTPTKTPKSTKTPGSAKVPKGSGSGGAGGANIPASYGTQPAWNQARFPSSNDPPATTLAATTSNQAANSAAAQNNGQDGGHIALIATLIALLSGAFVWCWRLFRTP